MPAEISDERLRRVVADLVSARCVDVWSSQLLARHDVRAIAAELLAARQRLALLEAVAAAARELRQAQVAFDDDEFSCDADLVALREAEEATDATLAALDAAQTGGDE